MRSARYCRSWLFLPGADRSALLADTVMDADVLIQELEDFTPPSLRPGARELCAEVVTGWHRQGRVAAVRINPLEREGELDLKAAMKARADVIALPKVHSASQIVDLDHAMTRFEEKFDIAPGTTRILPNIEYALGVVNCVAIARSSPRVDACLLAAEDLAADLGAVRDRDGEELRYARQRFLLECRAAGVTPVDCPYTWSECDPWFHEELRFARRLGYLAKSSVSPVHIDAINSTFTPSEAEIEEAERLITAFEAAREQGQDRARVDGSMVEMPNYLNAQRVLQRASGLASADRPGQ